MRDSIVISDYSFQGKDSFIALGPIHRIDKVSIYKPSIQLIYGNKADFTKIKQRLAERTRKRRKSFQKPDGALTDKEYFFVVLELIRIFRVIKINGIEYVIKSIFGHARMRTIKHVTAVLVGAGLVSRCGWNDEYYYVPSGNSTFMEFEGTIESRIIYRQSKQREDCFQKAVIKRGLRRMRRSA